MAQGGDQSGLNPSDLDVAFEVEGDILVKFQPDLLRSPSRLFHDLRATLTAVASATIDGANFRQQGFAKRMEADSNRERRAMNFGDWVHAAASLAFGSFLGSLVYALTEEATTDWPFAVFMALIIATLFFFMSIYNKLFDWFVMGSSSDESDKKRKPLTSLISLPAGFVLGIVLARLGLDDAILRAIL